MQLDIVQCSTCLSRLMGMIQRPREWPSTHLVVSEQESPIRGRADVLQEMSQGFGVYQRLINSMNRWRIGTGKYIAVAVVAVGRCAARIRPRVRYRRIGISDETEVCLTTVLLQSTFMMLDNGVRLTEGIDFPTTTFIVVYHVHPI